MIRHTLILTLGSALITSLFAATLASPLAPFPGPRVAVGIGYQLDGFSIGDREIPALLNRVAMRMSFSPIQYVNLGIEGGAAQMEVAADTSDIRTLKVFHGNYKFSYSGNLKLSSPMLNDVAGVFGIAKGSHFASANSANAEYDCYDGTGVAGFLFHIPGFGYAALGPKLHYIKGLAKDSDGLEHGFTNVNNLQGWIAVEWFPPSKSGKIPYITAELSAGPKASFGKRTPVNEFSFSVAIGTVTKRLGEEVSELEWRP